jgi:hypothetical protein
MFKNRFLIVLGVLSLLLVAMVISISLSNTPTSAERGRAAEAARWTAMGEYYQNRAEAENLTPSRTADAARWEAMGRYYQQFDSGASLNLLRSRAADTARWTAMAEYYQKLAKAEAQNLARARAADAARWTAMGEYYAQFSATRP